MVSIVEKFVKSYIQERMRLRERQDSITELYKTIYEVAKTEFPEDNKPTLDSYLTECFEDAMKPANMLTADRVIEILVKEIVANRKQEIVLVFPRVDMRQAFRKELKNELSKVLSYLIPPCIVESMDQLKYDNGTIRFLTTVSHMRGLRVDQVYYYEDLPFDLKRDMFLCLRPCVSKSENMLPFI
jgi:hypothetical protein